MCVTHKTDLTSSVKAALLCLLQHTVSIETIELKRIQTQARAFQVGGFWLSVSRFQSCYRGFNITQLNPCLILTEAPLPSSLQFQGHEGT